MSRVSGARPRTSGSPIRLSFAQSSATSTRSETSSGQRRRRLAIGMKPYSPGSGASPCSTITVSFPSWSNASFAASRDPSASPSGFSCVVRVNRSWPRIASTTAERSLAVVWGELIDQLRHADPPLYRRIVLECELRGPLHSQLACDPCLEDRVRGLEPLERAFLLPCVAEPRHEHAGVPQIRGSLDGRHSDESDSRILELTDRLRQDLADRLVDAPHPIGHARYSIGCTPCFSSVSAAGAF